MHKQIPVGKEGRSQTMHTDLGAVHKKHKRLLKRVPLEPVRIYKLLHTTRKGTSVTNAVGVTSAYADAQSAIDIITLNKKFIIKEVLQFIKTTYSDLEYADTNVINHCRSNAT